MSIVKAGPGGVLVGCIALSGGGGCGANSSPNADAGSGAGVIQINNFDNLTERGTIADVRLVTPSCPDEVVEGGCLFGPTCNVPPSELRNVSIGVISYSPVAMPVVLTPDSDARYTPFASDVPLVMPGQVISIASTGDEISAISASLTTPTQVTVTKFGAESGSDDYIITWTGESPGTFSMSLAGGQPDDMHYLVCSFPVAAGRGVVPGAALDRIGGGGYLYAGTSASSQVSVGEWSVTVRAEQEGIFPDGTAAQSIAASGPGSGM